MGDGKIRKIGVKHILRWLYEGEGKAPFLFRWSLLVLDFVSIAFFLWEPFHSWQHTLRHSWAVPIDIFIACYIAIDFAARLYIAPKKLLFFRKLHNIADVLVVLTLVAPFFFENLIFLRVLRIIRIVRAFTFLARAEEISGFLARHRMVIDRVTNFVVFLFIMSALVYVNQVNEPDTQIKTQLDALYFTVTSLTTTGYGDILMQGQGGRVLAIIIMLLGLTLFVRMLQSIVSGDEKIKMECQSCSLTRHDPDAIFCRRCGATLKRSKPETDTVENTAEKVSEKNSEEI